jgi:hypothetical protein
MRGWLTPQSVWLFIIIARMTPDPIISIMYDVGSSFLRHVQRIGFFWQQTRLPTLHEVCNDSLHLKSKRKVMGVKRWMNLFLLWNIEQLGITQSETSLSISHCPSGQRKIALERCIQLK